MSLLHKIKNTLSSVPVFHRLTELCEAKALERTAKKQLRNCCKDYEEIREFFGYRMDIGAFPVVLKKALNPKDEGYLIPSLLNEYRETKKRIQEDPDFLMGIFLFDTVEDSIWQYSIRNVLKELDPSF